MLFPSLYGPKLKKRLSAVKKVLSLRRQIGDLSELPDEISRTPRSGTADPRTPNMRPTRVFAALCILPFAATVFAGERPPAQRPTNANWQTECAACHVAFPPSLLDAGTWRRLMDSLEHHFGTDASLDAKTRTEITDFLVQNAATGWTSEHASESMRITETEWFIRKHERKAAKLWLKGKVSSPANCNACHKSQDENLW